MVLLHKLVLPLGAAFIPVLTAQQPATPVAFNDTSRQESVVSPANMQPKPQLTPEMRGDILMARKQYREAIDAYNESKQISATLINKMGIAYHQMMETDLAKKYYEKAIKMDPKYSEAINNLGTVHYAKRSFRRAISQYKKALKLSPNSASIYSNLGTAHFARKKYKDAAEAYEKALSLDPEVFERRGSHGVLLQERTVQERAKFHFYMAKTYAKAGVVERALLYIRKSLEEGFKERDKYKEDPEFAMLQELPEFQQLMALQPRVL
jgi:tetratricopeptide (TPR) repeat protein